MSTHSVDHVEVEDLEENKMKYLKNDFYYY
jgi:hypothetical protein